MLETVDIKSMNLDKTYRDGFWKEIDRLKHCNKYFQSILVLEELVLEEGNMVCDTITNNQ